MIYNAIGVMSGSSLDGIDLVFTTLQEQGGTWQYELKQVDCQSYPDAWKERLSASTGLAAGEYVALDREYGTFIGSCVHRFIEEHGLHHQVSFVVVHGHTTFHDPAAMVSEQLGNGAVIASILELPVITGLRSLDVAFGGQGAPLVPMGEKLLFSNYRGFLNLGGIANISIHDGEMVTAYDVCPANRVLNMIAESTGRPYDDGGAMAATGHVYPAALDRLNELPYYRKGPPKSLANDFGTQVVYPLLQSFHLSPADALRTCVEHIAVQLAHVFGSFDAAGSRQILTTGGGAFNSFLVSLLGEKLAGGGWEIVVPDEPTVKFKEALIMALLGALRWREQYTVLPSVTGARRGSIGGGLWLGTEA